MSDNNGRVKLTFGQIAWGLSLLLGLGAAWYDMRSQVAQVRADIVGLRVELGVRVQKADQDHAGYERRLDRLEVRRRQ